MWRILDFLLYMMGFSCSLFLCVQAKNIKNKPIVNRDPQSIRFEEMQCEIKALREELHRQRTSLMTGQNTEYDLKKVIEDAGHIKHMEDKVVRLVNIIT